MEGGGGGDPRTRKPRRRRGTIPSHPPRGGGEGRGASKVVSAEEIHKLDNAYEAAGHNTSMFFAPCWETKECTNSGA